MDDRTKRHIRSQKLRAVRTNGKERPRHRRGKMAWLINQWGNIGRRGRININKLSAAYPWKFKRALLLTKIQLILNCSDTLSSMTFAHACLASLSHDSVSMQSAGNQLHNLSNHGLRCSFVELNSELLISIDVLLRSVLCVFNSSLRLHIDVARLPRV